MNTIFNIPWMPEFLYRFTVSNFLTILKVMLNISVLYQLLPNPVCFVWLNMLDVCHLFIS